MKKIILILLAVAVLSSGCFSGCTVISPTESGTENTVTVTDHAGNTVTLPAHIERIAVCDVFPLPSVLAVFFNSADRIVAMAPASMSAAKNSLLSELYPEILNADTSAISAADANTEELMKTNPQVVFYSASDPALGEKLTKAGFSAVAISATGWEYNAVETLGQWIALLSQIFPDAANGREEHVRQYSADALALIRERTDTLTEAERQRIFFLFQYSEDTIVTSGQHFFGQWWADAVGAVNAAGELTDNGSLKVSLEQVYSWNPGMILITNFTTAMPEDLYNNTVGNYDWHAIGAVKDRKVYKMPLGMYRSYLPGIDTPITLLWLAKTVYPALFEDIDIPAKTVEYYETVFGVRLTDKQAERIFKPEAAAGMIGM